MEMVLSPGTSRNGLSGHLQQEFSVERARTGRIQGWASASEDGVCEKADGHQRCWVLEGLTWI